MLSQHPVNRTLLHPLLDQTRNSWQQPGSSQAAYRARHASYVTEENFARAEQQKLRLLAPLTKDPATHRTGNPAGRRDLTKLPATARPPGGCAITAAAPTTNSAPRPSNRYSARSRPAKMTTMSRRGFDACHSEWLLAATAHNLRKLHSHRLTANAGSGPRAQIRISRRQPGSTTHPHHSCPRL